MTKEKRPRSTPGRVAIARRRAHRGRLTARRSRDDRPRDDDASGALFAHRVDLLGTESAFKISPYIRALEEEGHHVIRCNLGEPDFPLAPHIREEIKRQIDNDLTHYCDPQGILPLREAIAADVGRRRGLRISPDRVVVFAGGKPPIGFCEQVYCDPGDEVVYPSPGFPIYESFTRYVGAVPVPLHLAEEDGFSFTGTQLEPLVTRRTKLIFVNFPSNPTGGVASRDELASIADVVRRRASPEVRVYSDEVYEAIVFDGETHRSIASLPGLEERTIIVSGVSKTYSWTGGRVGWAVFPSAREAAVFTNFNINVYSCLPAYNQMGAKVAIESRESGPEIARMVAAFQERRDVVVRGLNAIEGITCRLPKGAFYAFPNVAGVCQTLGATEAWRRLPEELRTRTSPSTLFQRFLLFRYHVATMDRRSFGAIGAEGRHYLRLSVATGLPDLREAVARIGVAARDREGFAAFLATKEGLI
jgi:aspartate/methionine/tyrosine aminotransferase